MKYLVLLFIFVSSPLLFAEMDHSKMNHSKMNHADGKKHDHSDDVAKIASQKDGKILIKVKGMVCAFCAQGIEKNFNKKDQVKETKVDLDKMEVEVHLKKGKNLTEEEIKKVVTGAGFSFEGIK